MCVYTNDYTCIYIYNLTGAWYLAKSLQIYIYMITMLSLAHNTYTYMCVYVQMIYVHIYICITLRGQMLDALSMWAALLRGEPCLFFSQKCRSFKPFVIDATLN